jgi:ATP-dependent Clp protease, protease subunit
MPIQVKTPEQDVKIPEYWNVLFLNGEINESSAIDVSQRLLSIDLINQNLENPEPVNLVINSGGGSLNAAWQICDMMDFIDTPVYTVGLGLIASAALVIFMNGSKGHRTLSNRCSLMSHQYSWGAIGNHSDLLAVRKEQDVTMEKILKHYKETTKLSEKVILSNLLKEHDVWLTPEEAIKFNIADKIVSTKNKKKKYGRTSNKSK